MFHVDFVPLRLRVLPDLADHLLVDLPDQVFQPHDSALPCLEGLAVLAVHGAETNVYQLRIIIDQLGLPCAAEHLLEI